MLASNEVDTLSFVDNSLNTSFESYSEPQEQAQEGGEDFSYLGYSYKKNAKTLKSILAYQLSDFKKCQLIVKAGKKTALATHNTLDELFAWLECNLLAQLTEQELSLLKAQYNKELNFILFRQRKHTSVIERKAQNIDSFENLSPAYFDSILHAGVFSPLTARMSTGKSKHFIKPLCEAARRAGYMPIVIAHRISLIDGLAEDTETVNYQSLKKNATLDISQGFSCCINSICSDAIQEAISKAKGKYIILIDEYKQTLYNFDSTTFPKKGKGTAQKCLDMLMSLMKNAHSVTIADADMNDYSLNAAEAICRKPPQIIFTGKKRDDIQSHIHIDHSRGQRGLDHLLALMMERLENNEKILLVSGVSDTCEDIKRIILEAMPDKRILLLNGNATAKNEPELARFKSKPDQFADEYDMIIFSPSVTSGVSIKSKKFTVCFSYHTQTTISHAEAEQQKLRCRNVKEMISIISVGNKPERVLLEREQSESLMGYTREEFDAGSPLNSLIINIKQQNEDSLNNFIQYTIARQKELGYRVKVSVLDSSIEKNQALKAIKEERKLEKFESLLNAEKLDAVKALELKDQTEKTHEDMVAIEAHAIRETLALPSHQPLTEEYLSVYGDDGRGIAAARRLFVISDSIDINAIQEAEIKFNLPIDKRTHPTLTYRLGNELLSALLGSTTLVDMAIGAAPTFSNSQLEKFCQVVDKNAILGAAIGLLPNNLVKRTYKAQEGGEGKKGRARLSYVAKPINRKHASKIAREFLEHISIDTYSKGKVRNRLSNGERLAEHEYSINEDKAKLLYQLATYQADKSKQIAKERQEAEAKKEQEQRDREAYQQSIINSQLEAKKAQAEYFLCSQLAQGYKSFGEIAELAEERELSPTAVYNAMERLVEDKRIYYSKHLQTFFIRDKLDKPAILTT